MLKIHLHANDIIADVHERTMSRTPWAVAVWAVLDQRLHALLPRVRSQRIPASPAKAVHLVLVGPTTRATIDYANPRVVRRGEVLRSLIDAMVSHTFEGLIRPANFNGVRSSSDWVGQTKDEEML